MKNKTEVTSTTLDGKEKKVIVKRPDAEQRKIAQLYANKALREALDSGAMIKARLQDYLRKQGLWDDDKEKDSQELLKKIREGEKQLKMGGKTASGDKFTLVQAKELALNMRRWRNQHTLLVAKVNELDEYTAESLAENARFEALLWQCIRDEEGNRVFDTYDDYEKNKSEPFVIDAAEQLGFLLWNLDPDFEKNLPENKFLVDYKFVDNDLRLVNKDGHLVDFDGKLIDKEGNYVKEDGKRCDRYGNLLDKDGNIEVEFVPFSE